MLQNLPPHEGVGFIVSWQEDMGAEIPPSLKERQDIKIFRFEKKGLSNNRNNAIEHCEADIILIADDDLEYYPDSFHQIREVFTDNPSAAMILLKMDFPNAKSYPREKRRIGLPLPKNYYISSVEIAFRRGAIGDLQFWPEMGLGNNLLGCGEEELFVASAIKRGYECLFMPLTIGRHPEETTGDNISPSILRGHGFIIGILYPVSSFLRIPLKAYRTWRKQKVSFFKTLRETSKGFFYSKTLWKKIPKNYKW